MELLNAVVNTVLFVLGAWMLIIAFCPKHIFDLVHESQLTLTVLEHFRRVAAFSFAQEGLTRHWNELSPSDKNSNAATQHELFMREQRMGVAITLVYCMLGMLAPFVTFTLPHPPNVEFILVAILAIPIWGWHMQVTLQEGKWNHDLEGPIRIHTDAEHTRQIVRALILALVCFIFFFR